MKFRLRMESSCRFRFKISFHNMTEGTEMSFDGTEMLARGTKLLPQGTKIAAQGTNPKRRSYFVSTSNGIELRSPHLNVRRTFLPQKRLVVKQAYLLLLREFLDEQYPDDGLVQVLQDHRVRSPSSSSSQSHKVQS